MEVRPLPEVLATLDQDGRRDGLPFMPEMARFCGQRYRVSKRAEKTCYGNRFLRLGDAVHLAGVRCDGSAHDGCQLGCLAFWKEEWLRPVEGPGASGSADDAARDPPIDRRRRDAGDDRAGPRDRLPTRAASEDGGPTYVCQATALRGLTHERLNAWDPRQYFRELRAGNAGWAEAGQLFRWTIAWAHLRVFKAFSERRTTPRSAAEEIVVGDWVEVRTPQEILATLNRGGFNRGLRLSEDMLTFCGERFRVQNSVTRFVDETTGKMRTMRFPCLVLESATCRGFNILCPRAQYHFWRPEWLRRLPSGPDAGARENDTARA